MPLRLKWAGHVIRAEERKCKRESKVQSLVKKRSRKTKSKMD
jgi:hypothetical protein